MPKVKTRKSAAKRFKLTASGKLMRRQAGTKHLLHWKTKKRIRNIKGEAEVSESDLDRVSSQLPYKQYLR
jgi:large subunit ribosomal protein L35